MRAAVYYNNRDVRVEERPVPSIGAGEVLVRIEASGICGSDVMEWYRIKKAPLVLGHEISGTITAVGQGVTRFKEGDRVTVAHHVPCNTCRYCLSGNHSVCDMLRTTNFDPGGFCEYVRVPAVNVDRGTFVIPDSMSFEDATFIEPLGCVVRAFRMARFTPGTDVLVIGSGMSGLLHIKLAKALGAGRIAATDINDFRLKAAKASGADAVMRGDKVDVPASVKEATGRHPGLVILCAASEAAIAQALKSVDRGGTIILFAPLAPGATYPFPLFDLWRDNITIINSYASPPLDTQMALDLIASGRVVVRDMITHRLGLGEAQEGFRLAAQAADSIKVVIEPQR